MNKYRYTPSCVSVYLICFPITSINQSMHAENKSHHLLVKHE